MAQAGSVDILCPYGGDYALTPTGDLALVIDSPGDPAATKQRIERILMVSPTLYDAQGNPIGYPDDPNNPKFGAGLPSIVGMSESDDLETDISAHVLAALALDPGIVATPEPTVTINEFDDGTVIVSLTCDTTSGETVSLAQPLH